jgi:hypothetical protein
MGLASVRLDRRASPSSSLARGVGFVVRGYGRAPGRARLLRRPSTAEPGQVVTIVAPLVASWDLRDVTVSVFVPPAPELAAPILALFRPSTVLIAVPWKIPPGTATVRVAVPGGEAEYPLIVARTSPAPNVEGYYWNIITNAQIQLNLHTAIVSQTGSIVTVDLSVPSGIGNQGRPGWIFTGNLSPNGDFRASASTPGCEQRTLALTFSETGYVGLVECEDPGVVDRMPLQGFREG